jgi:16S rRNA (uracil1498-N3)-methyltransferase
MPVHYIYLPDIESSPYLSQREIYHLKVLRVNSGSKIRILDGKGSLYEGVLDNDRVKDIKLLLTSKKNYKITLLQSLIRPAKIEFLLQKVTEIGIHKIIFFPMKYSNFNLKTYVQKNERFNKILIDAIKQSHNLFLPKIEYSSNFYDLIPKVEGYKICFYEKAKDKMDLSSLIQRDVTYLIGPEGGISDKEVGFLKENGFKFSKLCNNILRAETAAMYALSVLNFYLS